MTRYDGDGDPILTHGQALLAAALLLVTILGGGLALALGGGSFGP